MTNINDLNKMYQRRFSNDAEFRNKMWKILCKDFFQKYISDNDTILEIAAGYCEFINNINAKKKIALDLNPDIKRFASKNVEAIVSDATNIAEVENNFCDKVFMSNFFEHLTKEDIVKVIKQIWRILKKDGQVLILQPNVRLCYKDYYNFFDHITPLDDKSLREVLELSGFEVVECRPKFLPYSTKSRFPKNLFLIKLYLRIPVLQYLFGRQVFICAKKIT